MHFIVGIELLVSKLFNYKTLIVALGLLCLLPKKSYCQIKVQAPDSVSVQAYKQLVKKTLIGNGVLTGHFEVKAPLGSIALFDFESEQDLVKEGLVLSTGSVDEITGPNDTTNTSTEFFGPGDEDLSKLIGRLTADAVSVEFDFIPYSDSIGFYYFFASEEYPEYVGKGFNDAFAFLIQGPGFPYYTNIARLQVAARSIPITIDNINFISNKEQFISNHLEQDRKILKPRSWQKMLGPAQMLEEMEFDGMTVKLRATAKVYPGEIYRLKIVIADVGDLKYDSGVFLEKESFGSPYSGVAGVDTTALLRKFADHYQDDPEKLEPFLAEYPEAKPAPLPVYVDSVSLSIFFKSDSFLLDAKDKKILEDAVAGLSEGQRYKAVIKGHTDSTGSYAYNVQLSKKRAHSLSKWLMQRRITSSKVEWVADKEPETSNRLPEGREKNRRTEVLLIRQ